jgi:LPS O-antigen subunit length determinant protein (WzzB/FepE family)
MVIDNNNNNNKYKKKKSITEGFIRSEQVVKELNTLLKYYGAENVQPDLEQTQKILDKFDINKELVEICEI